MDSKRMPRHPFGLGKWIAVCWLIGFSQLASANVLSLASTSPSAGPLLGGARVTITGEALYLSRSVTFGGVPATILSSGVTFIVVSTPPHAVGPVDVVVVNSAGLTTELVNGYTYSIAVTTSALPAAIAGISYSQSLAATGGLEPYHWSIAAGSSLPSGLSLNATTGMITGAPAANYGPFTFTVQAADSSPTPLTATASVSITIDIGLHPGPVPASFFGISTINPANWPSASFGAYGKGEETEWPYLEPAKGEFNWKQMDKFVANAEAHGFTIYWTTHYVPQWAAADTSTCIAPHETPVCTSTVANIADWDEFCTALVKRYKGRILMYELWNEPNTPRFTGTTADMVELTQHLYNAVRANDPGALIASPSATNAPWLSSYFAAGGPTGVDVVAVHGYLPPVSDDQPETLATYKVNPWHPVMLQYGLENKPIWDTEGSWGKDTTAGLDADAQAAFLVRYYLLHWSAGVTSFSWYAWDSSTWGTLWNFGVVNKAGLAYTEVYQWMTGATMPQPCTNEGTVYTCTLTRPNGYSALAVWDAGQTCTAAGGCTTSNYTAPTSFVQVRNLLGEVIRIQPRQVVLITAKPILLENKNPPK
jgi:Putative Ig domain/Cellulase (glycosyl hydrolase family 5)